MRPRALRGSVPGRAPSQREGTGCSLAPLCPADAERGRGAARAPDATALQRADLLQDDGLPAHGLHPRRDRRHRAPAARHGFSVDATEDADAFTRRELARYDVVDLPVHDRRGARRGAAARVRRYVRAGGGFAGIHSAVATEYGLALVPRARRRVFPRPPGRRGRQRAVPDRDDERRGPAHGRHAEPRQAWTREEEWYNFRTNPRDAVHVLLSVDESTYDPRGYSVPGGSPPMGDHPISWCHEYDGGRSFYTALGHKGVYWEEPLLLAHVLGGIEMAAGVKSVRLRLTGPAAGQPDRQCPEAGAGCESFRARPAARRAPRRPLARSPPRAGGRRPGRGRGSASAR